MPTRDRNGTIIVPALRARANFGKMLYRIEHDADRQ